MTADPNPARDDLLATVEQSQPGLRGLLGWVNRTLEFRTGVGASRLPIGYFANVVDLGGGQGLAISTDGVGTTLLLAQLLDRYDTIGIDCVAMNVNDVLCVGARPIAMVDYLATQEVDPEVLDAISVGLVDGARQADISIPGGEIAQLRDVVRGVREGSGFDLAGAAI